MVTVTAVEGKVTVSSRKTAYAKAALELAEARVRFSEAFILFRSTGGDKMTDKQAEHMAIIKTKDEITKAQASLEIARRDLNVESTRT